MTVDDDVRLASGFSVLLSLALGVLERPCGGLFTAFAGWNVLLPVFRERRPLVTVLRRAEVSGPESGARKS